MQIAIDGPAGAGKSSVAREVARRLKLAYLDTGAMYRAVTLKALQNNVDITDGDALVLLARTSNMDIQVDEQEGNLIYWGGENITRAIRSPDVNKNVSVVAESPELRKELVSLQRKIAKNAVGIVMEGRDIGTNVLPGADYKFFLTAQVNERARRRWKEIKEKDIKSIYSFEELVEEISTRDRIDQGRADSPLLIAPGAYILDTTPYPFQEVVEKVVTVVREAKTAAENKDSSTCDNEVNSDVL